MTWNHRVLRTTHHLGDEEHVSFAVHEVYYDDDGQPTSWSKEPALVAGDTWVECIETHSIMSRAFILPVLEVVDDELFERADRK